MSHIFQFEEVERGPKLYVPKAASDEAEEAMEHGRLFYKIDGSNGMILITRDGEITGEGKEEKNEEHGVTDQEEHCHVQLTPFKRFDAKGKPPPERCIPLPVANNPDAYPGHTLFYEPMPIDCDSKGQRKINKVASQILNDNKYHILNWANGTDGTNGTDGRLRGKDRSDGANGTNGSCSYLSVEWVGRKFNKTPGVPHDVAMAIHAEQICNEDIERTYEGFRSFLLESDSPIEGLVVEFKGTFWKIRADCFDRKCPFKTDPESVRPPIFLIPK